ncbi:formate dehydrogenase accessory sulfurtransferase FdhD [Solimicrobium silvestre]|uniref:Sulfur carrier protein FdhD n=1 Tax=Solimicrobium silvestre TaxID=2099400 RepID=A0A2S9GVC8_9BURK|nr:formate dehydrogenase accessory sulfurtransferase FdhD [Solimicrobium silvestre]PRC91661.1 Formate dehydrogenase family accessory protein FdhD [Solimicrobium silvestre]
MQNENPDTSLDNNKDGGYGEVPIQRYKDNAFTSSTDFVATEVPVAMVFNGISHAVMLATPLNLTDFAIGFSFSEGIISHRSEVYEIEEIAHPDLGLEIHLTIANACFMRLKERRRSLVGRTGCGICGLESLSAFEAGNLAVGSAVPRLPENNFIITQQALFSAFNSLKQSQAINLITGSMHAAAWVNAQGEVMMVREDLGRHNALDKLIGAIISQPESRQQGCVLMTSRASYELVQKAARAGMPLLAAISAPTSLAINLAQQSGMTLIGFVRNEGLVAYAHPERIRLT